MPTKVVRGPRWQERNVERHRRYEERMRDYYKVTSVPAIMGKTYIRPDFTLDEDYYERGVP